ncbi:hypothetical protein LTR53_004599 [Teratosphaeriaceae sp. CCFEE 6253]|nr:hypothetical protein LTR53_004599 [Teratosphaeriaceae sp. CCFEE 6253]
MTSGRPATFQGVLQACYVYLASLCHPHSKGPRSLLTQISFMHLLDRLRSWGQTHDQHRGNATAEDERLIGKESSEQNDEYKRLRESERRLKRWIVALSTLLGLAVLAIILAMSNASLALRGSETMRGPVPFIPSTKVTFERDELFAGPETQERDAAWSGMMPAGDGFILIANHTAQETHHLPLGKATSRGQVYDISVFHQLHCLANIRKHLFLLQAAMDGDNKQDIYDMLLQPQEDHVHHCFDYIRQALMCAGDMTVEWPRTEEDGSRFAVDGWGITHECRDWDAIMGYMEQESVANIW